MTSEEYKSLIHQKNVLDHTTLNITLKELTSRGELELAEKIKRIIEQNKIAKPDLHGKPHDTSSTYYKVDLTAADIDTITDIFFDLEESHTGENGEPTPTASFYASLVDRWNLLA